MSCIGQVKNKIVSIILNQEPVGLRRRRFLEVNYIFILKFYPNMFKNEIKGYILESSVTVWMN